MKYLIKYFAVMLLLSTMASISVNAMHNPAKAINNTITVQNRNNNEKSTLQLRYTSEKVTPNSSQSESANRSITLNAAFIFKLPVTPNENGLSSLTILDPNGSKVELNRLKSVTISAHDNDTITIQKKQNDTINILNNVKLIDQFIY